MHTDTKLIFHSIYLWKREKYSSVSAQKQSKNLNFEFLRQKIGVASVALGTL